MPASTMGLPLSGLAIVTLAMNVPGPAAAARLVELGARVTKIEPPEGDPLSGLCPAWYEALAEGQQVLRLGLKTAEDRTRLAALLDDADLLLTSQRASSLARLGLARVDLERRFPQLSHVAIVGYPEPQQDRPGHDLSYLAPYGLLDPPTFPRTLVADLGGAERAVSAALSLLYARERGADVKYAEVSLAEVAGFFSAPVGAGLTSPGGALGGALAGYGLYRTGDGWIAVCALEDRFQTRLRDELGLEELTSEALARAFEQRGAAEWEAWAIDRDIPIAEVRSFS